MFAGRFFVDEIQYVAQGTMVEIKCVAVVFLLKELVRILFVFESECVELIDGHGIDLGKALKGNQMNGQIDGEMTITRSKSMHSNTTFVASAYSMSILIVDTSSSFMVIKHL